MRWPDFLLVGAAKCGSTTLTRHLAHLDGVFMPLDEIGYFSRPETYARGRDWYLAHFSDAGPDDLIGENSNYYTMVPAHEPAVQRIEQDVPDSKGLKILYLVRDPLDRMASMWIEKRSHGGEDVHHDFNRAVREDTAWLLEPSRYWHQIQPFVELVGADRVQIVFTEDMTADPLSVVHDCATFLGIPGPATLEESVRENPSEGKRGTNRTLSIARQSASFRQLRRAAPPGVRRWLRTRAFSTRLERPAWDDATRALAIAALREDAQQLLAFAGKPSDYWDSMR